MPLPLDFLKELPEDVLDIFKSFGLQSINLDDKDEKQNTLDHMAEFLGFNDPIMDSFVKPGSPEQRKKGLENLYIMDLAQYVSQFNTAWIDDSGLAQAWWMPSQAKPLSTWGGLKMMPKFFRTAGFRRGMQGLSTMEEIEKCRPSTKHWFLYNIACAEEKRGEYRASALILLALYFADKEKVPVCLFIANPDNEKYYNRFGFQLIKDSFSSPDFERLGFFKCMIRPVQEAPYTLAEMKKLLGKGEDGVNSKC